jgi:DNA-binding transcriptional ArsR family regulator
MSNHSAATAARADDVFDALGDPTRRQIIARLRPGPTPVGKLADQLTIGRPAVSKHLRVLEGAGVVEHHRVGTRNLYALAPAGLVALQQWLVDTWDQTLSAYAQAVTQRVAAGRAEAEREEHRSGSRSAGPPSGRRTRRR